MEEETGLPLRPAQHPQGGGAGGSMGGEYSDLKDSPTCSLITTEAPSLPTLGVRMEALHPFPGTRVHYQ